MHTRTGLLRGSQWPMGAPVVLFVYAGVWEATESSGMGLDTKWRGGA